MFIFIIYAKSDLYFTISHMLSHLSHLLLVFHSLVWSLLIRELTMFILIILSDSFRFGIVFGTSTSYSVCFIFFSLRYSLFIILFFRAFLLFTFFFSFYLRQLLWLRWSTWWYVYSAPLFLFIYIALYFYLLFMHFQLLIIPTVEYKYSRFL